MTHALAERPVEGVTAPVVTTDQLELVKKTIAPDATADELKLYLYDCARQGVHPLDRLIHFTKRNGKYTPITSIDFMRIRAADTGEYAGSDDAVFEPHWTDIAAGKRAEYPAAATITVWRLVQGQRCSFTATARWGEYKPEKNDFMWRKMPHTMLAKCAEALALRKGFPKQLAGLYAKEEMDQAGPTSTPTVAAEVVSEPAPEGYDNWRIDLEACADQGREALNSMWADSNVAYRNHLRRTEPQTIDTLRARAQKAAK